jgi:tight adherence protein B
VFSPTLIAFLGAATVIVFMVGVWYPRLARERMLRRRVGVLTAGRMSLALDTGGRRRPRLRSTRAWESRNRLGARIDRLIEMAGLELTASELLIASGILASVAALLGAVLGGPLVAALGLLVGAALPTAWIVLKRRRRKGTFARQLPDTVALLASAVRAGHSLMQGLEQVAREAAEPTKGALEQVVREIGLGASQDEALDRLAARFPSQDLDLMVTSVGVQHQVGGSLAVILDEMADTLRERDRINREIDVLTSPQRYSAYVLALLPVFVVGAMFLVSRDYMAPLFEGVMRLVAAGAALMALFGFLIMRRMATIDV